LYRLSLLSTRRTSSRVSERFSAAPWTFFSSESRLEPPPMPAPADPFSFSLAPAFVAAAAAAGATEGFAADLAGKLTAILSEQQESASAKAKGAQKKADNSRKEPPPQQRRRAAGGSRREALQSHISSLAEEDLAASASSLRDLRQTCVDFLRFLSPSDTTAAAAAGKPSALGDSAAELLEAMLLPAIPSQVASSLLPNEDKNSFAETEDAARVFGCLPTSLEEIFDQQYGGKTAAERKRKRSHKSNEAFERAIQELKFCGLITVKKRKLKTFVSPNFQ